METATVCVRDVQPSGAQYSASLLPEQQAGPGLKEDAGLTLAMDLTRHLLSEGDLRDFLRATISSIRRLLSCDAACLFLKGGDTTELEAYAFDISAGPAALREGAALPVTST